MKKVIIVLVILALAGVIIVPRVINNNNEEVSQAPEKKYVTVEVEKVTKGTLSDYAILTGTISAEKTVQVIPTVPALVDEITVKVGDSVKEGDILFKLDTSSVESQVTQAKAGLSAASAGVEQASLGIKNANQAVKQAQIGYDLAKVNYDKSYEQYLHAVDNLSKYEQLYIEGIVSEAEYEQMKLQASDTTLDLITKQLEQAEQALSQANIGVDNAKVAAKQAQASYTQASDGFSRAEDTLVDMTYDAPIQGFVTAVNIVEDVFASNAQPAITIEAMDTVKVHLDVTENMVNQLVKGNEVDVFIESIEDKAFKGTITSISPSADLRTLLYAVEIDINNTTGLIKPGMFADIKLKIQEEKNSLYVKGNAVFDREGKTYLYMSEEDSEKAVLREVEVGLDTGEYIQITKGVVEEELYITKGIGFINEDTLIDVVRSDAQ